MIQITDLRYNYSKKKSLFHGLSLRLLPGKTYGLLGKNGAGKSSLIKNIAGLLHPTKGTCICNGFDSRLRETGFLEQLFFIPEECELPRLSIPEFIRIYAPFYPNFETTQFSNCLEVFNVDKDSNLHRLSFGQKKKAYIAFALAANTSLLIMDEPTNGLDIPSKIQFRNMVSAAANKNRITIMSTHQVRDLDDLIDAVIILDNGEILLQADKDEINQKLYFTAGEPADSNVVIHAEETPNGKRYMLPNDQALSSYMDLEILFNATLKTPDKVKSIFTRSRNQ